MSSIRVDSTKQLATSSLVVGYALCSSLLAVINKFAITKFNYPGLLTALQYLTSALGVWVLGKLGFLYHDSFSYETAKKFLPAALVFYLAIFTNTNLLRHANVDTFIVFRSLTPLLVAIADTLFRKQPIPSKLTFVSLFVILGGAVGYVATDSAFTLTAYSWALAYLVTITSEMVYIKHIVSNIGLNTWGLVFYNNLLSLMMAPLFWILTGEYSEVFASWGSKAGNWFEFDAFFAVSLSCIFGFLISFFGFAARKAISATAFTVIRGIISALGKEKKHRKPNPKKLLSFTPAARETPPISGNFFLLSAQPPTGFHFWLPEPPPFSSTKKQGGPSILIFFFWSRRSSLYSLLSCLCRVSFEKREPELLDPNWSFGDFLLPQPFWQLPRKPDALFEKQRPLSLCLVPSKQKR